MSKPTETLLLLLFATGVCVSVWNSCNSVDDRQDYKALQDSLDSTNAKIDQLYIRQDHITKKIDSLSVQKVTIIEKYVPIKQAIRATNSVDTLAAVIRSGLDTVFSR